MRSTAATMGAPYDPETLRRLGDEHKDRLARARQFDPEARVLGAAEPPASAPPVPECRLLLHHVAKRENVGTLLRSAAAFGVREVVTGSQRRINDFGHLGSRRHLRVVQFTSIAGAIRYLKADGFAVLGIEIDPAAVEVDSFTFSGPTAFLMGNEGDGLDARARGLVDGLVYVGQAAGTTASLNVAVATSICLHRFSRCMGYPEAARRGGKYELGPRAVD